jgi:hypothetical protein
MPKPPTLNPKPLIRARQYIRDADQMAKDAEIAKTYNRNMWQRHKEHTM